MPQCVSYVSNMAGTLDTGNIEIKRKCESIFEYAHGNLIICTHRPTFARSRRLTQPNLLRHINILLVAWNACFGSCACVCVCLYASVRVRVCWGHVHACGVVT